MNININLIRRDGGTQPRAAINHLTVTEYAEDMKEGAEFPPVTLFYDGTDYWLVDGFHRVEAAFAAGLTEVSAEIKQGTRRDAILYSVGANASHGLRRSNADKRRAVITLLDDPEWKQWSNCEIARRTGVNEKTVRNIKESIFGKSEDTKLNNSRKANRGGKTYEINATNIGKKASSSDKEQNQDLDVVEDVSLSETTEPELSSPQHETDPLLQQLKIGQLVTVTGDHLRTGQSGYVTALPNLSTAIVEFENGERELLKIENLIWDLKSGFMSQTEEKTNSSKFYPQEGVNYRAGIGCEWYVRVEEETWNKLLAYQASEGAATLDGAINRLLFLAKELKYFSNNTEL